MVCDQGYRVVAIGQRLGFLFLNAKVCIKCVILDTVFTHVIQNMGPCFYLNVKGESNPKRPFNRRKNSPRRKTRKIETNPLRRVKLPLQLNEGEMKIAVGLE